jgi:7-cyano-7-deazaguanine synthase
MDSTTTAALAQRDGFDVHALSVRYGQRHAVELDAAFRVSQRLGIRHHVVVDLDLRAFGGSALTADLPIPKDTPVAEIGARIPATYVPARNTIFLALALAWAETLGASDIYLGANALDYSGYPDCRPEYLEAFARMASLATRAGVGGARVTIHTPLLRLTKAQIVALGSELGLDYGITSTCYDRIPAERLRALRGLPAPALEFGAELRDPARYRAAHAWACGEGAVLHAQEKARTRGGPPCSATLPDAICGRGARRIAGPPCAASAIPTSWAPTARGAASSPGRRRSPLRQRPRGPRVTRRPVPWWCVPGASRCSSSMAPWSRRCTRWDSRSRWRPTAPCTRRQASTGCA